jgi:hypothetical protein
VAVLSPGVQRPKKSSSLLEELEVYQGERGGKRVAWVSEARTVKGHERSALAQGAGEWNAVEEVARPGFCPESSDTLPIVSQ